MNLTEEEKEYLYEKYKHEGMTEEEIVESINIILNIAVNKATKII